MSERAFFDTSVLASTDGTPSPGKQARAIELHRLTNISFWDTLIVHAARSSGAAVLYSEDLQSGPVLGGVRVVNPFPAQ